MAKKKQDTLYETETVENLPQPTRKVADFEEVKKIMDEALAKAKPIKIVTPEDANEKRNVMNRFTYAFKKLKSQDERYEDLDISKINNELYIFIPDEE